MRSAALALGLLPLGCADSRRDAAPSAVASGVPSDAAPAASWSWPLVESAAGAFAVRFPAQPEPKVLLAGTARETQSLLFEDGDDTMFVTYTDYATAPDPAKAEQILDDLRTTKPSGRKEPITRFEARTVQGYPGRFLTRGSADPASGRSSALLAIYVGHRYYQVGVTREGGGRIAQADVERFFGSFKLAPEQLPSATSADALESAKRSKVHRTVAGTPGKDGWYVALSTEGGFSVAVPQPFIDFTIGGPSATGHPAFGISATSPEGVKCVALATEATGDNGVALDVMLGRMRLERKVVTKRDAKWHELPTLDAELTDASGGELVRFVRTPRFVYALTVEFPNEAAEPARRLAGGFFESLQVAKE